MEIVQQTRVTFNLTVSERELRMIGKAIHVDPAVRCIYPVGSELDPVRGAIDRALRRYDDSIR